MTDAELGQLLVEKKKLSESITTLTGSLWRIGDDLSKLAKELKDSPETIVFANAPEGMGNDSLDLQGHPPHAWTLSDFSSISKMVRQLRQNKRRIAEIESRLGS